MKVSLKECKAERVHLRNVRLEPEAPKKDRFNLVVEAHFLSAEEKSFLLLFGVVVARKGFFILEMDYSALFETTEVIEKGFMQSPFPAINAPAIAYPFLRSFVSTLCVNAGYRQLLLPTLNFTQAKPPAIYFDGEILEAGK